MALCAAPLTQGLCAFKPYGFLSSSCKSQKLPNLQTEMHVVMAAKT